ncbi:uncharacterized protein LOC125559150 [Nematostella vectensis]|uniref:uncharacterized protein LOC125559150 n=1 Tax=Nematostella vectensis TaxID=45351 RepID=UPI0020772386|nr:uncharacterized protein LOC125559150 [Nematostella vectensis]
MTVDSECVENVQIVQSNLLVQDRSAEQSDSLESEIARLWDLETLGFRETQGVQEEFLDNICFNGERYSVKLPWKVNHRSLPTNYENSLGRLHGTMKKLRQEPEVLDQYEAVIKGQLESGVIEPVHALEDGNKIHYLPHRAVVRRNVATSTPVRVIYDASAKTGKRGLSLNDCLHVGPSLNPLLFNVLLRFRLHRVALIADIEKAFLNIEVDPGDRDCLRFLFPEDPRREDSVIKVYRFCRVVFGLNASPFLLNGTLRHHLLKFKEIDPEFVEMLVDSFYVDDLVTGSNTPEEAYELYVKSKSRLAEGGFNLRKWQTNDSELRGRLDVGEGRCMPGSQEGVARGKTSQGVASDWDIQKVLGLPWNSSSDTIGLTFGHLYDKAQQSPATKRNVLSVLAGMFDPLGIVSPVTVAARILFKTLCRITELTWDEELTGEVRKEWEA